jgi:hypothetical protein
LYPIANWISLVVVIVGSIAGRRSAAAASVSWVIAPVSTAATGVVAVMVTHNAAAIKRGDVLS